eukprot:m51a1_g8462 putative C-tail anchored protein, putative subtilisin-like serine protease domain (979) ;mRNA; r:430283-433927
MRTQLCAVVLLILACRCAAVRPRLIVQLAESPDRASLLAAQDRFLSSLAPLGFAVAKSTTHGGAVRHARYAHFNAVAVVAPEGLGDAEALARVRSAPGVAAAWRERRHEPALYTSGAQVKLRDAWAALSPERAGAGVKIAVVDAGTHRGVAMMSGAGFEWPQDIAAPGLGETENCNGKIVASRAYFRDDDPPGEQEAHSWPGPNASSHGVHTTSVAAGVQVSIVVNGRVVNISGMAPGAWVMNYKVFYLNAHGAESGGWTTEILAALDDAVSDGADVVCNPWGAGSFLDDRDPISLFTKQATEDPGVVFVFSVGNNGPELSTADHAGSWNLRVAAVTTDHTKVRPLPPNGTAFARFSASADTPDVVAAYSSRGPSSVMSLSPDVAAPGSSVIAAGFGAGHGHRRHLGYGAMSGTSVACAHVAGAAALVLQANPGFTPAEVRSALATTASGSVVSAAGSAEAATPLEVGAGRVDVARAVAPLAFLEPQAVSFGTVPTDSALRSVRLALVPYRDFAELSLGLGGLAGPHGNDSLYFSVSPSRIKRAAAGRSYAVQVDFDCDDDEPADFMARPPHPCRFTCRLTPTRLVVKDERGEKVAHAPVWARVLRRSASVALLDMDWSDCDNASADLSPLYLAAVEAAGFSAKIYRPDCGPAFAFPQGLLDGTYDALVVFAGTVAAPLNINSHLWEGTSLVVMGPEAPAVFGEIYDAQLDRYYTSQLLARLCGTRFIRGFENASAFVTHPEAPEGFGSVSFASAVRRLRGLNASAADYRARGLTVPLITMPSHPSDFVVASSFVPQEVPEAALSFRSGCAVSTVGLESFPDKARVAFVKHLVRHLAQAAPEAYVVNATLRGPHAALDVRVTDPEFALASVRVDWGDGASDTAPAGETLAHRYRRQGLYVPRVMARSSLGRVFALRHAVALNVTGALFDSSELEDPWVWFQWVVYTLVGLAGLCVLAAAAVFAAKLRRHARSGYVVIE